MAFASAETPAGEAAEGYIDLHLQLDGAITLEIAKELAALQNIELPGESDEELKAQLTVPEDCESLNDFLECFALPLSLMQTPEGLSEAVRLVCENIKSHGVIYAELRWAPQLHTEKGMTQEDAILAALEGLKKTDLKAITSALPPNREGLCWRMPSKPLSPQKKSEMTFVRSSD